MELFGRSKCQTSMVSDASFFEGFGAYKRHLLFDAFAYVNGVYEAWWRANTLFPERALSERLAMAEQAIRELLAEGLIALIRDEDDPRGSEIPRSDTEEVFTRFDTWVVEYEGIKVHFTTTSAGDKLVNEGGTPEDTSAG
jgi:hypothetical protein